MTRTPITIAAAVFAVGCAGTGGPSGRNLTYSVPSPRSAFYHIGDTMSIDMDTPGGSFTITGAGTVTIALAFASDPVGVRITGTVEAFEGSIDNPMMGTQTAGLDDVSGTLEVLVGRHGVEELASFPELAGPVAQMSSFPALAFLLFPRMPVGDADPGATWVDTVAVSTDTDEVSTASTTVSTYTLVGDTVVDGRTLAHIAVATHITTESDIEQGGMSITQSVEGPANGFFLWDPERRLVVRAEYERSVEGTMSMANVGTMSMAITGPTRIRLEG